MTRRWIKQAIFFSLLASACGGGQDKYTIPADSPMKEFSPPDEDDLTEDDWDALDDEESGSEEAADSAEVPAQAPEAP